MGLIRRAAHSMFGDRVPSSEERTLRHQAKQLRRLAKWANRLSSNTAATRMVNQQALHMALAYETIREQRYRRLAAKYTASNSQHNVTRYMCRAECSRAVILQLQQQLLAYQPLQQPLSPVNDRILYSTLSPSQQQQQRQSPTSVAAIPVNTNYPLPPPPAYSAPPAALYPTVTLYGPAATSPTSSAASSSASDCSLSSSSFSDRSQLQEPWLQANEKRTLY